MSDLSTFEFTDLDGRTQSMRDYVGSVVLVVNVASKCGFTPQYAGLQALGSAYRERGLVVIGVSCDQFGHQEPGDAAQIRQFCSLDYAVDFPLSSKIEVNGNGAHPLWQWLKHQQRGVLGSEAIKWNFTKFLIGRDGTVLERYAPTTKPEALAADIERALGT